MAKAKKLPTTVVRELVEQYGIPEAAAEQLVEWVNENEALTLEAKERLVHKLAAAERDG